MSDLLHDEQLENLGRIKIGLVKLKDAIERINILAKNTGLEIRNISTVDLALMANDISILAHAHELAEKAIQERARATIEKLAA